MPSTLNPSTLNPSTRLDSPSGDIDFSRRLKAFAYSFQVLSRSLCLVQDPKLAREAQQLFASPYMRVNTTTDVTGVEICGALKNVLAIAAGIVEGLDLGHNAMAALVAQVSLQGTRQMPCMWLYGCHMFR